jgi:primosomal protein N' (replication factor Y)
MPEPLLRIAIPTPLRRLFDYLPPRGEVAWLPGQRVRVPFGRRQVIGVVAALAVDSDLPRDRLKQATERLDDTPLWPAELLALLTWAADYYHHPLGEVFATAMPVALRDGRAAEPVTQLRYRVTEAGRTVAPAGLARAPRQAALLGRLLASPDGLAAAQLAADDGDARGALQRLVDRGLAAAESLPWAPVAVPASAGPALNPAQADAVEAVAGATGFAPFLLDGVTGSGKTEVYLQLAARTVAAGRQVLVLVPEIGLTPQLLARFRERLGVPVAALHSGLADGERLNAWLAVRDGRAPVLLGTRSAVFTPFRDLGLVILDEEHDASFKQQDGFRYHARDVAVMRASRLAIPIVLGSATPSLESLHNARQRRYRHLLLPARAGGAVAPRIGLLDVRHRPLKEGLSEPLRAAIAHHLAKGGQVLVFLNRRGYAPTLLCHDCGEVQRCRRCDAHLVLYAAGRLRCHHCGHERPVPPRCPACGTGELRPVGHGTERLEQHLAEQFPDAVVLRVDRDSTRRKGSMEALLERVHNGEAGVLVGTQMLAKGHDFPGVTLAAIVDADHGLFSADFRAAERMAQLIVQVAGRAGRAERPGEVVIQTHCPEHPLLVQLVNEGYPRFAEAALAERQATAFPPYGHLALLRAEAVDGDAPLGFLTAARDAARPLAGGVHLLGPVPAPMERRAGRVRAQLLLQADQRAALHRLLEAWLPLVEALPAARKVRWSLDVDPVELY